MGRVNIGQGRMVEYKMVEYKWLPMLISAAGSHCYGVIIDRGQSRPNVQRGSSRGLVIGGPMSMVSRPPV